METFYYHITRISGNAKTGPIPVTTTGKNSCPDTCPLKKNGCYADGGPLNIHWNKVTSGERGLTDSDFLKEIKALPKGQLWRHNQAGDLPHSDGIIDESFTDKLIKANKGKNGFTYTHHKLDKGNNIETVQRANKNGFTVNISANNISEALDFYNAGFPTVTVLPIDAPNAQKFGNTKVVACPAEKSDKINCANCGLCAESGRNYIIGFRAHGISKKKANIIATGGD